MPKLSDRKIVTLHQLSVQGATKQEIARALGVHRNTVTAHLKLRIAYPRSIHRKIGSRSELIPLADISIYDAAAYLPGFPSRDVVYRLHRAGVLRAKQLRGRLVLSEGRVRSAVRRMLPPGLWFRTDLLSHYTSSPTIVVAGLPLIDCRYWPCSKFRYASALDVYRRAEEVGVEIVVPASVRRRAAVCLELFEIATV